MILNGLYASTARNPAGDVGKSLLKHTQQTIDQKELGSVGDAEI